MSNTEEKVRDAESSTWEYALGANDVDWAQLQDAQPQVRVVALVLLADRPPVHYAVPQVEKADGAWPPCEPHWRLRLPFPTFVST
jgi:hypothetical protein